MKISYTLLLWIVVLFLPMVQMIRPVVSETGVNGTSVTSQYPHLTLNKWFDGSFQRALESWVGEHIGFRGAMIRTNNQINFSLFREITSGANTHIVLGKNNFLYEKNYIDIYLNRYSVPDSKLITQINRLMQLENALRERGIGFLFVLSPSKASVYPEFLPDAYARQKQVVPPNMYERIKPMLEQSHLTYLDGHELMTQWKNSREYSVFTRGGTHWSYYSACLVDQVLISMINQQMHKTMQKVICDPPLVDSKPYGTDRDLLDLINIWRESDVYGVTPHPAFTTPTSTGSWYPHILYVGDSFVWTLAEVLHAGKVAPTQEVFYYYKSMSSYPDNVRSEIVTSTLDWERDVFSKDVIIIEANETGLGKIGFGFVEDALQALQIRDN